jgi:outer membrane protein assembly factor BamB
LIILNAGGAGTAVHKQTGEIAWTSNRARSGYATPVPFEFQGRPAVAIFSAKALVAIDPATGRMLWEHPWESPRDINAADPIVSGDKIFISSESGSALLRMREDGVTVVWNHRNIMRNYFNPSVLIDGHLTGSMAPRIGPLRSPASIFTRERFAGPNPTSAVAPSWRLEAN